MLQIRVEEPEYLQLEREGDAAEFERALLNYMMKGRDAQFRHPKIAVFVVDRDTNYKMVKEVC